MNKQDEEKAREIANQSPIYFMHIYNGCIEMAQWKDEQFYKFLLWLDDNCIIKKLDGEPMIYSDLIDNFKLVEQQ